MTTEPRFGGRTAVVTGASRGIGAAVALQLAVDGADVAIVARSVEPKERIAGSLNETAARVRDLGRRCVVMAADLTDEADRARVIPEALDALGTIDILVNNAAAAMYGPPSVYPLKRRRLTMEVNFQAPADLSQAVIPHMAERGAGWIVNLTSATARHADGPPFAVGLETGVYGASKAALDRFTNAMGAELHGTGVRVNAVMPRAAVLSEGADALVGDRLRPDQIEPMETMVEAVLALCECDADRTGKVFVSLDLLAELAR